MATWTPRQLSDQVVRSLTASKITSGRLAVGTEITVGDPTQAHLSIGGTALRVWRPDSDGGLRTTIQLGGAERDVVQITDPDTGETIAGFTDDGDVVGRDAAFQNLSVGGMSVGYWEYPDDALWIQENIPRIAANLVLSLTEYFGLPYTAPTPQPGQVSTVSGGPVNLRSGPSLQSPVTARLPDGDGVTVYGRYQDWYVVSHGEHLGYVSAPFIRLS